MDFIHKHKKLGYRTWILHKYVKCLHNKSVIFTVVFTLHWLQNYYMFISKKNQQLLNHKFDFFSFTSRSIDAHLFVDTEHLFISMGLHVTFFYLLRQSFNKPHDLVPSLDTQHSGVNKAVGGFRRGTSAMIGGSVKRLNPILIYLRCKQTTGFSL